jgi:hypothetical protein
MFDFIQPLLTLLIGLALSLLAMVHGIRNVPASAAWQHVAQAAPQLGAVLVFVCCVMLAVIGVGILIAGLKACRVRLLQLRQLHWNAPVAYGRPGYAGGTYGGGGGADPYDDERDWR